MGKRKFTSEQAREALLATGVGMLSSIGPAGVATVTLAEVISRSGVPRPSAYRVFGGGERDPQRAFHEQLVLRTIANEPGMELDLLLPAVASILDEANAADASSTPEQLTTLLVAVINKTARTVLGHMSADIKTGVQLSAMALVRSGGESSHIAEAIAAHRDRLQAAYLVFFREIMSAFGLRLRPGWTDQDLFTVFNEATIGAVLAAKSSGGTDIDGRASSLTLSYLGLTALAVEPDTRRVVSAQPAAALSIAPDELR